MDLTLSTTDCWKAAKQWIDKIWFVFVKASSDCCVKNRLQDTEVEAGSPVKSVSTAVVQGRENSGWDQGGESGGHTEKYLAMRQF